MELPETRYAKTPDGLYLAYQVIGEGPTDIVWLTGRYYNIEIMWEHPSMAGFLLDLSKLGRLIVHDRRGTGLSDRNSALPNLESRMSDLLTILDAAKAAKVVLVGAGEGGALAALVAAGRPDRVGAFIWCLATARSTWAPDYPWGYSITEQQEEISAAEHGWGTEAYVATLIPNEVPSLASDPTFRAFFARIQRHTLTPGAAAESERMWFETDVRDVLPSISAPTLLIDRDGQIPEEGEYIASLIPGAERVLLHGADAIYAGDTGSVIRAIKRFLGVERPEPDLDRVLTSVLFTDIVGSTERAAREGDARWDELIREHHACVREELGRFGGKEIDTAGDGFFATFDGPARAASCGLAIVRSVRDLGLEVRVGVHTGEVEKHEERVRGIAVHVGARISALAHPSEVLCSSTVKDLTAGSGLAFEDMGEHELKGVPDRWHLYRVTMS